MHPIARYLDAHLPTAWLGEPCVWHAAVGSTNAAALDWAASGAPAGALVGTDDQTRGRGRLGRTWDGAPGLDLAVSVVLRPPLPPPRLGLIPLGIGLAVAEALGTYGLDAALKWPNDVLVGGRKVCGILAERRSESASQGTSPRGAPLVVGVGVNVNRRMFPIALAASATSLALALERSEAEPLDRAEVLVRILVAAERRLDALFVGAFAETLRAYTDRMTGVGEAVRLLAPSGDVLASGTLHGVEDTGALVLDTVEGRRRFHAGEVSLRPAPPAA